MNKLKRLQDNCIMNYDLIQAAENLDIQSSLINLTLLSVTKEANKKTALFETENFLILLKARIEIFQNFLELEKEKFNATNT